MVKVLCAGDLHIGRRASRIPAYLDGARFSAREAWQALVETALRERVDLVALSGDLVDQDNRYFEAIGPLESGVRNLAEAGISVCAVAGNHDFDVLPNLARDLGPAFMLLGAGGCWERHTIVRDGAPVLHVDGWSFTSEHVARCPLDRYDLPHPDDAPVLGLLHADLDQPGSVYAPVTLAQLQRQPAALWLLGHVHAPRLHADGRGAPVLYPGSPLALDPGETDPHGVWLVDLLPGRDAEPALRPISRTRYVTLEIALDGAGDVDDVRRRVTTAVQEDLAAAADHYPALEVVSYRLALTGRTALHGQLDRQLREPLRELRLQRAQAVAHVDGLVDGTRPEFVLAELRGRRDPAGELARMLARLEDGDVPEEHALVNDALARLREIDARPAFAQLNDAPPDPLLARGLLLEAGYRLLDALLAQREGA